MAIVKGKWLFNDIVEPHLTLGFYDVSFTSNGNSYTAIHPYFNSTGQYYLAYITNHNTNTGTGDIAYSFGVSIWYYNYKTVNFGTTEQTVSDEFYTWLTANATNISQQSKTLSGIWKFNDTVTMDGWAASADATKEFVNFTTYRRADESSYNYIGFNLQHYNEYDDLQYLTSSTDADLTYVWAKPSTATTLDLGWQSGYEKRKTIDFGTAEQVVSDTFYTWLTANATQVATIKGVWVFKEVLSPPSQDIRQSIDYSFPEQPITDFSEGSSISLLTVGKVYFHYINLEGAGVSSPIYVNGAWKYSECRTVDFGTTEQAVSDEFYTWLIANASEVITDLTNTTWVFNTSIAVLDKAVDYELTGIATSGDYTVNVNQIHFALISSGISYFVTLEDYDTIGYDSATYFFRYWTFWEHHDADGWNSISNPPTLTITGGTDATNTELIAWLTENATQVEEEEPETPAIIKAGTYRFNDVLTKPPFISNRVPLNFSFEWQQIIGDEESIAAAYSYLQEQQAYFEDLGREPTEEEQAAITAEFRRLVLLNSTSIIHTNCQGFEMGCDSTSLFYGFIDSEGNEREPFLYYGGEDWGSDCSWDWEDGESVKTITLETDQTVEADFYTWFTENTKEVKAISGKRRFKDTLTTAPFTDHLNINFTFTITDVDFDKKEVVTYVANAYGMLKEPEPAGTLKYRFGGSGVTDISSGRWVWSKDDGWLIHYLGTTREELAQYIVSEIPDIDDTTLNHYLDELYKCYGEDIKTVDFGKEPQYVPVDAWDWIMENTEPVITAGMYKFNDTLTRPLFNTTVELPFTIPSRTGFVSQDIADWWTQNIVIPLGYPPVTPGVYTGSWSFSGFQFHSRNLEYSVIDATGETPNVTPYSLGALVLVEMILSTTEIYHSLLGGDDMDDAFQVITVLEDTAVEDEDFATWFIENTKPVVKKFTRLYSGDIIASSGGKCFKRLKTTIKEYALSVIAEGNVTIIDHTAPSTIKEGETITFNIRGNKINNLFPRLIHTTTADVSHVNDESFVGSYDYSVTVSNATGDVTITLTDDIAPDPEQGG